MQFLSTRATSEDLSAVSLDKALVRGIASDGGLFLPVSFPHFTIDSFDTASNGPADSLQTVANVLLAPFFESSQLRDELPSIVDETFNFDIPVVEHRGSSTTLRLLELFHGPTAAFKDVGARFLSACLTRLEHANSEPLTVLVATSGDTGGAVAAAFDGQPGMRVAVLYPNGRVSDRQAQQLSCWSDNVLSLAVNGSFDDCQAIVKAAMAADDSRGYRFSSANSINIGRLLPQAIYYAHASLHYFRKTSCRPDFFIPTGNLGNAFAAYIARAMGLPVGDITLVTNANRLIVDFLEGAPWLTRDSVTTLANAMDVGNASNMERLRAHGGDASTLRQQVSAMSVNDEQISAEIARSFREFGVALCPHTATAVHAWRQQEKPTPHQIIVATAHAAKFEQIVEPIIGETIPLPPALSHILERPQRFEEIAPSVDVFFDALNAWFQS